MLRRRKQTGSPFQCLPITPHLARLVRAVRRRARTRRDNGWDDRQTVHRSPDNGRAFLAVIPARMGLRASQTAQFGAQVKIRAGGPVTWTINPVIGTITPTGTESISYTPPASISAQQTVTIRTTSVADSTKSATATVTLYPPAVVTVSPTTAALRASQTQQFTANVAYATSRQVTWSVVPAGVGTVSATGLYTAPTQIAADQSITVKATSVEDLASATVNLKKLR